MKDIKTIFEGLFSADVADLKAPEPIEIPEMDGNRAFILVKPHIQDTNNAIKEHFLSARLDKLKGVLGEFEPQEIEDAEVRARKARNNKKADMWNCVRDLKSYLTKGFEVEDSKALDNYNLWAGFAKVIEELFKDSQVKKYILSKAGVFVFDDGEVYWEQNKKTEDVDAVMRRIQKILPSNLVSIHQEENWPGPEIRFDSAVLSNY